VLWTCGYFREDGDSLSDASCHFSSPVPPCSARKQATRLRFDADFLAPTSNYGDVATPPPPTGPALNRHVSVILCCLLQALYWMYYTVYVPHCYPPAAELRTRKDLFCYTLTELLTATSKLLTLRGVCAETRHVHTHTITSVKNVTLWIWLFWCSRQVFHDWTTILTQRFKPIGNYMYHLLHQSVTQHFFPTKWTSYDCQNRAIISLSSFNQLILVVDASCFLRDIGWVLSII
jgi:hypothetical protein